MSVSRSDWERREEKEVSFGKSQRSQTKKETTHVKSERRRRLRPRFPPPSLQP